MSGGPLLDQVWLLPAPCSPRGGGLCQAAGRLCHQASLHCHPRCSPGPPLLPSVLAVLLCVRAMSKNRAACCPLVQFREGVGNFGTVGTILGLCPSKLLNCVHPGTVGAVRGHCVQSDLWIVVLFWDCRCCCGTVDAAWDSMCRRQAFPGK